MSIAEKLQTIAENEQKVYNAGVQAESDRFWEDYQQYGARKSYMFAFAGQGWKKEHFKPKYNIVPTNAYMMFHTSNNLYDIYEYLDEHGLIIDFSKCTEMSEAFRATSIKYLRRIDTSKAQTSTKLFAYSAQLETIEAWVVNENSDMTGHFSGCTNLKNLTIEGTIGKNGLNLSGSTLLSHDSIVSIINALSTTTSGLTVTLSKTAVNTAFNMTDGNPSTEWSNLVGTKQNWTISLV